MNLFSILEESARRWPRDTAVVHAGSSFSYSEICDAAESLAAEMQRAGVKDGEKVGVMFPKGVEEIVACFAVMRANGIAVQIPQALNASEIVQLSEKVSVDVFCYPPGCQSLIPRGRNEMFTTSILKQRLPVCIQWTASGGAPSNIRERLLRLNAASIGFTSGTTSESKGIILSHEALLARARIESKMFSVCRDDCILYLLSITYSCAPPIVAALLTGATTLFADAKEIPAFPQLVARHGVTLFYASPLVYRMILNEGETIAGCLGGVRLFITTGSRLPDATAEEFRTRAGKEIVQRYGLNECGGVLANLSGDRKKRGSVGIAAGMEVKLKVERDAPRKDGAPGELLVRGPGLFEGYCSPWRLRDEVLDDGWFKTGDLMRRDEDGYYWIVGRTKEVINVGGVKVFPHEVEEMLLTHPAVEEALVFGVAEPRFGEAPHGKVKLRAGAACTERELLRFVNERLSVFKTLRAVEFVNEIPKTVTDKPKRSGAIKSRTV